MKASGLPLTPRTLQRGTLFCVQFQGGWRQAEWLQVKSSPYPISGDGEDCLGKSVEFPRPKLVRGRRAWGVRICLRRLS